MPHESVRISAGAGSTRKPTRQPKGATMASEPRPYDAVLAGAWNEFCDRLKEASTLVFADTAPTGEVARADGIQYIARYVARALNDAWNFKDPLYPQLWTLMTPTSKAFGDNPDGTYLTTWLDGQHTYRIVGNRGTVTWVSFVVAHPRMITRPGSGEPRPATWWGSDDYQVALTNGALQ